MKARRKIYHSLYFFGWYYYDCGMRMNLIQQILSVLPRIYENLIAWNVNEFFFLLFLNLFILISVYFSWLNSKGQGWMKGFGSFKRIWSKSLNQIRFETWIFDIFSLTTEVQVSLSTHELKQCQNNPFLRER